MEITTRRFLLRDFDARDWPAFEAYHADPRSAEFYGEVQSHPDHARELFELFSLWTGEVPRCNYQLAVVRRDADQALVGCCGLRRESTTSPRAELGIELAPDYWGRYRYAIEVMVALAEFGFAGLGLREIYGGTVSTNARIARLAESFGARAVVRPAPEWMAAKGWQQVEWQIGREQWQKRHATDPGIRST
ncbi:GNAT family N-acetyltransferase [Microbulbifer halophilus]|uniref:GNAT family N-acetyltransferase n=1 Tax=Microbulbifer halophilus TaxID=453963 RepID=A0ABW5E7H9_9GAMM|nr:GNAT family N-acetyltransferase [Microbulbifer halophilus]MCW8125848.1 GNAT family N-acetyltransferase [Microbulbifer halophilus]